MMELMKIPDLMSTQYVSPYRDKLFKQIKVLQKGKNYDFRGQRVRSTVLDVAPSRRELTSSPCDNAMPISVIPYLSSNLTPLKDSHASAIGLGIAADPETISLRQGLR